MEKVITFLGAYNLVVAIGGIGASLGVLALYLRHKDITAPWARRLCLVSDMLNTAFVSATVVGVLTVSFQLAIHLPDLARSSNIPQPEGPDLSGLTTGQANIIQKIDALAGRTPVTADLDGLARSTEIKRLDEGIQDLTQQFAKMDLYSTIEHLYRNDQLHGDSLTPAVRRLLGSFDYSSVNLSFKHEELGLWTCLDRGDRGFHCFKGSW